MEQNNQYLNEIAQRLNMEGEVSPEDVVARLNEVEFLTDEKKSELMENTIKTLSAKDFERLPERTRREIDARIKGTAYEMREKELLERFGVEFKRGEDYSDMFELVERIVESRTSTQEDIKPKLDSLRKELMDSKQKISSEYERGLNEGKQYLTDLVKEYSLKPLESRFGSDESAKKKTRVVNLEFDARGFKIENIDGQFLVTDSDGQIVTDKDAKPKSVDVIMQEIASEFFEFQQQSQIPSRNASGGQKSNINQTTSPTSTGERLTTAQAKELLKGQEFNSMQDAVNYLKQLKK